MSVYLTPDLYNDFKYFNDKIYLEIESVMKNKEM